jgi:hypothetical protein
MYEDDGVVGGRYMRHYKVIYEKHDFREVWIETNADSPEEVEEVFMRNFERYDDESDTADVDLSNMDILEITEIGEDGEEI